MRGETNTVRYCITASVMSSCVAARLQGRGRHYRVPRTIVGPSRRPSVMKKDHKTVVIGRVVQERMYCRPVLRICQGYHHHSGRHGSPSRP